MERYSPVEAWNVLKKSFRLAYERLGMVVLMSVIWYFATFTTVFISGPTIWAIPIFAVVAAPLHMAIMYCGNLAAHREDAGLKELWQGYKKFWTRAALLGAIHSAVILILWIDIQVLLGTDSSLMRFLSGVWVYLSIFVGLLFMYAYPIIVEQDTTVWKSIRRAVILILDNPAYTFAVGLLAAVFFAAGVLPTIGILAGNKTAGYFMIIGLSLYAGFASIYRNLATVRALQRYDAARMSGREKLARELEVEKMAQLANVNGHSSSDGQVAITWFGHACFMIQTGAGLRILTDPFDERVGYELPAVEADVVTVSHDHFDHNCVKVVKGLPKVLTGEVDETIGTARIRGIKTFHDTKSGALRGLNTVFVIETDGISICHAGDLGHIPSADTMDKIGDVDVLLVPVGGTYTLDGDGALEFVRKLSPKIVVPMHYQTPALKMELDGPEFFLSQISHVEQAPGRTYVISASELPRELTAVLVNYE
ncbi:MAG TPA: MBL fold metallo-hydrolase [Bacillota bacterium]|jgi:L-ascorbate metabolism protein UlaG (beta-lactamase superfamily)/uncharacterized membrane protein YesL|nr:hypothetical protein [Bacillota bacterium]HOL52035.1 MBL fold metallo-hydrolase [Bacillota bacterium]HOO31378.1 MBL fold metallo-hydrolase [Bacillota bacterium]HPQ02511.1 MBL fold metallo-hydrolase [Bacillota bacterium]HQD81059.1 MBL fold metallo-hydrolase [Bacillota bacterium]